MKALILAAGHGTRLYPIIKDTPKAFLEIKGKSLINYLLEKLEDLDKLDEVLVVTNNKFFVLFQDWAKKQDTFSCPIRVINDGTNAPEERLGSIGDIHFALKEGVMEDDLLVMGSDNLFNYDFKEFIPFCQKKKPAASIGLYDIGNLENARLFGVVKVDQDNKVISFEEKPQNPQATLVAMCLYYFPQNSLELIGEYITETKNTDRAGDYIRWLQRKCGVFGFKFSGKWYDIGSIESYREAQRDFN